MKWTTPKDLTQQVRRLWDRGLVLKSLVSDEPIFPRRLTLKSPSSRDLAQSFGEVREWSVTLGAIKHLRFVSREVRHRVIGTNTLPAEAWIDSAADAVALLGKTREWRQFQQLVETTRQRRPELLAWIRKRPLVALEHADAWERYLDLVDWVGTHPRPACYLRQVDLPGIDTKFIESHRGLLAELLDMILPEHSIDTQFTGLHGFCRRFGFREKPERVRFRILDADYDPLQLRNQTDLALDIPTAAELKIIPPTLFVTENETNFLAFPKVAGAWILFGAGYGFAGLRQIEWMQRCRIVYWGDIDTHGFAVLNELRHVFPEAESILMDEETLFAHRSHWGKEPRPSLKSLARLTPTEASLYDALKCNRIAPNLRLEQERISLSHLHKVLSTMGFHVDSL